MEGRPKFHLKFIKAFMSTQIFFVSKRIFSPTAMKEVNNVNLYSRVFSTYTHSTFLFDLQ